MPTQFSHPATTAGSEHQADLVNGELRCALTGKAIQPEEAYWAPPLITTRELISTVTRTLFTSPGNLGQILLGEQPNVPYAPDVREQLGTRRSAEQLKLIGLLLLIAALLIVPIVLLVR
ncbi:MAG: hypothetical protein AB4911_02085 [Oscillochloridaceae bacterium umkhey_bin13]